MENAGIGAIQKDLYTVNVFELISALGEIRRAPKAPTAKYLKEHGGAPVVSQYGCTVYPNGYVRYERDGQSTIMWLPDCTAFTCWFVKPGKDAMGDVPDRMVYDLSAFPWVYAVMLRGDARIEYGRMNRIGDRASKRLPGIEEKGLDRDAVLACSAPAGDEEMTGRWNGCGYIPGPEEAFMIRETVCEALRKLSADQRDLLIRYYYDGYTLEEIGTELGISASAVLKRIRTACSRLQDN